MHELYELKEKLMKELSEYSQNGKFSKEDAEVIKYLSSAIDHICNIVMAAEEEGYSEEGGRYRNSYEGGGGRYSYEGGGGGGNRGGGGQGGSYARRGGGGRGRGRNARRDSMGRYSTEMGYSRAEDDVDSLIQELQEMSQELPQEKQREVQKFIQKMEQM